jgi:hypothetical protein
VIYEYTHSCLYTGAYEQRIERERAHRMLRHAYKTGQLFLIEAVKGVRLYRVFANISGIAFVAVRVR